MSDLAGRVAKFFLILVGSAILYVGCDTNSLSASQRLALTGSDTPHLLSVFAAFLGVMFILMLVFNGRGFWWAWIDAVCVVGLLSLVTCPIYWAATGHWLIALAVGISGLLALGGTMVLYWRSGKMPNKKPLFPNDGTEPRPSEEEE